LNIRFKKYRHKGTEYYDDGLTLFSRFHPDGSGELFYPNGVLAIRVYRPENRKCNWVIYIIWFIQTIPLLSDIFTIFTDYSTGQSIAFFFLNGINCSSWFNLRIMWQFKLHQLLNKNSDSIRNRILVFNVMSSFQAFEFQYWNTTILFSFVLLQYLTIIW